MEGKESLTVADYICNKISSLSLDGTENKETASANENIKDATLEQDSVLPDEPDQFLKIESFFNWLEDVEKVKFSKIISQNETDCNTGLSACLQVAINDFEREFYENCEKAYYFTLYGTAVEDQAIQLLRNTAEKVQANEELTDDVRTGYNYLLKTLHAYLLFVQDDQEDSAKQLELIVQSVEDFVDLPVNTQITVLRLKFMSLLNFRLSRKNSSTLEELKKLQPENPKWHYFLYKYYRNSRKANSLRTAPARNEILSIAKAIELEPENLLYVITGFQNLSERLRHINPRNITEENPIVWQNNNFKSVDDVIVFMKDAAMKMLDSAELTDPGYYFCLLASIFSSFLPYRLLDFELADRCITKAYEITPNCTTINHRRGLIVWTKTRDVRESAFYLWQACKYGPKNLGARCDLLHLLLSKPTDQQDNIVNTFLECLNEANVWGDQEKSTFVFLKGCFLLMINVKEQDILNCWIDAYYLNSAINHFVDVIRQGKRYLWDKGLFNLELCKNVVDTVGIDTLKEEEATLAKKISEDISKSIEDAEKAVERMKERLQQQAEYKKRSNDNDNSNGHRERRPFRKREPDNTSEQRTYQKNQNRV